VPPSTIEYDKKLWQQEHEKKPLIGYLTLPVEDGTKDESKGAI